MKESRKKIQRPDVESVLGGGRKNISPFDIIPYLPDEDCFFDSRHWVYGTDVLPFALTTRIAANNQQYLKVMQKETCMKESKTDKVIYDGHLDIKGWHHKACEVISPDGICTCCHCQSNNLLQKITENMADQNAIELPSELKGKKFRIRKLTPRECFRLMGVDDKDIDKIQAAGVSNSGQYKLAGNSIVVDTLFHLFRKMFIEKDEEKAKEGQQLSLF